MEPKERAEIILANLDRIIDLTDGSFELDCADFRCEDCIFGDDGHSCFVTSSREPEVFSIVHSHIEEHYPEKLI